MHRQRDAAKEGGGVFSTERCISTRCRPTSEFLGSDYFQQELLIFHSSSKKELTKYTVKFIAENQYPQATFHKLNKTN
jgi:hypothetical protein